MRRSAPAWDVLLLVAGTAAVLVVALTLDTVTFQRLGREPEVYSILGGIRSLGEDGDLHLAAIVFLFSVVYPAAKLVLLAWLAWRPERLTGPRARLLTALRAFGRASLLDVFLIALFVGAIRGALAGATSRPGIQLFLLAVLLSMLAAWRLARRGGVRDVLPPEVPLNSWTARLVSAAAAGLLALVLVRPLLVVKTGLVFSTEVALLPTTAALFEGGEPVLAAALAVFVVAASVVRALLSLRLRFLPGSGRRARRHFLAVDEWAMVEVFALALVIVEVKLDQLASTDLPAGYWLVLAAGVVGDLDVLFARRAARQGAKRRSRESA